MASFGQPFPSERRIVREAPASPGVRLTRERYIHRIAVAWIVTAGKDPKHPGRDISVPGLKDSSGKDVREFSRCVCRLCRAWMCIRQTPADELAEAQEYAVQLTATAEYIDDRMFG